MATSRTDRIRQQRRRVLRIAIPGAMLGASIAYPVLIFAKLSEELPTHLTWPHIIFGPVVFYGTVLGPMWPIYRWELKTAEREDASA